MHRGSRGWRYTDEWLSIVLSDARKAFSPMNYSPMMEQIGNTWKIWPLTWPASAEFPGNESTFAQEQHPSPPPRLRQIREDVSHLELSQWIKAFNDRLYNLIATQLDQNDDLRRFFIIMDTGLAAVACMIKDRVLEKGFMAIEDIDMINGSPNTAATAPPPPSPSACTTPASATRTATPSFPAWAPAAPFMAGSDSCSPTAEHSCGDERRHGRDHHVAHLPRPQKPRVKFEFFHKVKKSPPIRRQHHHRLHRL